MAIFRTSMMALVLLVLGSTALLALGNTVSHAAGYSVEERVIYENSGENPYWWSHLRCTSIPQGEGEAPQILCTVSKDPKENPNLSDVFYDIAVSVSHDLGASWSPFDVIPQYRWKTLPDGYEGMLIDPVPLYHSASGKVILFGMAQSYDSALAKKHNYPAYAVYDPQTAVWSSDWTLFNWPGVYGHTGSVVPYLAEDGSGDILWPINSLDGKGTLQVVKCSFNGTALAYVGQGSPIANTGGKGNRSGIEPSLTRFNGTYFITMRDDLQNRLAKSSDGLTWEPAVPLTWDDGTVVDGSMNTQMHWITRPDGPYLVYTRQDASNPDVFRYRAPLWMARVDPVTLRLKKSTERVVMAITNDRAQLGNFGTADITPELSIVTSNEWNSVSPNRAIVSFIRWNERSIARWSMDEAGGATLLDGEGQYPGTVVNAVRTAAGKFGGALSFDGNGDYVSMGDPADGALDFGAGQDFSVSAWVKTGQKGSVKYIVNKGDTNRAYWLRFEADNTIRFLLDYGSTYDAAQSAAEYADGRWHHVAATASRSSGLKLYVDGVLAGQDTAMTGGNVSSQLPFTIGVNSASTMNGLIDGVSLYNYALGAKEVQALYGVAGHWRLDEPDGDAALDAGLNGYHGTIAGAARTGAGKYGGALSFDGADDYVSLGSPNIGVFDYGMLQNFSVSLWVKANPGGTVRYMLNKGDTKAGYWLRFEANNSIRFLLDYGSTSDAAQSAGAYADGQWHHVAAVADRAAGLKLYVDGVLAGEDTAMTGGNVSTLLPLTMGLPSSAATMNGFLDEVILFDYALSAADVQELYTKP